MTVELRKYQVDCIDTIYSTFKKQDKQLIQLPTGAGKTFIFLNYLKENSRKALIICPTKELQEQIEYWANAFDLGKIFVKRGRVWEYANFYIVTAQTLNFEASRKFLWGIDFDHIIIDEAHHAQAMTYKRFLGGIKHPYKLLGCTATPERLDGQALLKIFETMSFDRNLYDLIQEGYLCDIEAYKIKTGCKISARTINADFMPIELNRLDIDSRNNIILNTFEEHCKDKKTLIFCLSINHALKMANCLKDKGYSAEAIYGDMTRDTRRDILGRFKSGQTKILTNCQLLTEGFDEPTIEALIIARPTKSKSLYCQMIGRGVRKIEGIKDLCYLYELADNAHNLCSFNVAAGCPAEFQYDYAPGSRLTKLKKELENINLEDVEIVAEKISLFDKELIKDDISSLPGNSINLFKTKFYELAPTEQQFLQMDTLNIEYINDITFLEASFLIWKEKLKRKYGINRTERQQVSSNN
jgi:superfamily II DNA or RNA helicase